MNSIKFKAMFFTALVFGGGLYFLLGKPNIDFFGVWDRVQSIWASTEDKPIASSKTSKKLRASGKEGTAIDTYRGVKIYDNGTVRNVSGRNVTADGYNLGLKYQCVEFVKRFYYEYFNHKMPDSYGHAKDFFDNSISDGGYNAKRALRQYRNGSSSRPAANDLIVFGPTPFNKFGHVAIISRVADESIEIAQQNPGKGNPSRATYSLTQVNGGWQVGNKYVLGWLRK